MRPRAVRMLTGVDYARGRTSLSRQVFNTPMVTIDSVRAVAEGLPRSYEVVVRGRVKFRVGQIVWLAFSRDETVMGFAFPKEERNWLTQSSLGCRRIGFAPGLPHSGRAVRRAQAQTETAGGAHAPALSASAGELLCHQF